MNRKTAAIGTVAALAVGGVAFMAGDSNGQRKMSVEIRCALIDGAQIDKFETYRNECPPNPAGKPQYQWLPAPPTTPPTCDLETNVLEGPTYDIQPTIVVESWNCRAKTQAEKDADANWAVDTMGPATKSPICDLQARVQALEGATPAIKSEADCDAWIKTLDTR